MQGPPDAARAWQSSGMERSVLTARSCIFWGSKWKIRGARWNMLKCQTRGKTSATSLWVFERRSLKGAQKAFDLQNGVQNQKLWTISLAKLYLMNLMLQHFHKKSVPSFLFKILFPNSRRFSSYTSPSTFFSDPEDVKLWYHHRVRRMVGGLEEIGGTASSNAQGVFRTKNPCGIFPKGPNLPSKRFINSEKNPKPLQQWWLAKILSFSFEIVPFQWTCWILVVYID